MGRPARHGIPLNHRDRLRQDFSRAPTLRQIHPGLAEVRIELEFSGTVQTPPSAQSFSYFPAARGFFRFACPCHGCAGEFDLSTHVAELARGKGTGTRTKSVEIPCPGDRPAEANARTACPISARVRLSAVPVSREKSS